MTKARLDRKLRKMEKDEKNDRDRASKEEIRKREDKNFGRSVRWRDTKTGKEEKVKRNKTIKEKLEKVKERIEKAKENGKCTNVGKYIKMETVKD